MEMFTQSAGKVMHVHSISFPSSTITFSNVPVEKVLPSSFHELSPAVFMLGNKNRTTNTKPITVLDLLKNATNQAFVIVHMKLLG